jgi:hypothetical protein
MYHPFKAITFASGTEDIIKPCDVNMGASQPGMGTTMAIHAGKKRVVHITKQQAIEFFGLIEPNVVPVPTDKIHVVVYTVRGWEFITEPMTARVANQCWNDFKAANYGLGPVENAAVIRPI